MVSLRTLTPTERSPLLARPTPTQRPKIDEPSSPPPLGTARFPFHPHARTTPRWRKLLMHHFDDHGRVATLHESDLWPLTAPFQGARAAADLRKHLPTHGRWRLFRAVCAVNRRRLLVGTALRLCTVSFAVLRPLLLYRLVSNDNSGRGDRSKDIAALVGVAVLRVAAAFVSCHGYEQDEQIDLQTYSALYAMITDRIINAGAVDMAGTKATHSRSGSAAGHKQRLAEITKMLVNDVATVGKFLVASTNAWASVLKLAASATVLVYTVGVSHVVVWTVVATYAAVFAVELLVGEPLAARAESALMLRLNTVRECLKGIQMVKLNAWESKMETKILQARTSERVAANRLHALSLVLQQLVDDSPMLFVAVAFGVNAWGATSTSAALANTAFTPTRVFVALILLSDCLGATKFLKYAFEMSLMGVGAWRRVESFVLSDDSNPEPGTAAIAALPHYSPPNRHAVVAMSGVCLSSPATSSSSPTLLINVEWQVHRGDLVVIHGAAGLGKSMLLAAIRQDASAVQVLQGSLMRPLSVDCRVAYCSQDPWLQALSIRDNILFGTPFDGHKYWTVVDACGLLEDLGVLPAGDATAVGPHGINLSSGQCARIALARACYADADLYLLDCPLANVDAVVQSEIFHKCITELLLFKSVVIVTHNPEYIGSSYVDQLVHVQPLSVRVTNRASRRNLHEKKMRPVSRRLRDHQHTVAKREPGDRSLHMPPLSRDSLRLVDQLKASKTVSSILAPELGGPVERSVRPTAMWRSLFDTHRGYAILSLVLAGSWGIACVARDVWIMQWAAAWSATAAEKPGMEDNHRFGLDYAYLVAVCALLGFTTRGCIYILKSQLASRLFQTMTHAVLYSSMALFYHTPIGETINRYYSDMMAVDELLPHNLSMLVLGIVAFLTRALVVGWVLGPAGVVVLVVGYAFAAQTLAIPFCVESVLLQLRTKAKQLSLMAEVVDGEAVIRAFGDERALHVFQALDDVNDSFKRASYFMTVFNNSVIFHCEVVVATVVVALLGIVAARDLPPAEYGLVLLFIFVLQQDVLTQFSTGLVNTVISFSCVERLREYGNLPIEDDADPSMTLLVSSYCEEWPQHGSVVYDRVHFSYHTSDSPGDKTDTLALRDVSFSLKSGEKIGIIGRTGSGKSSLAMALLRVHPLRSGRILLDGVDLRTVPLSQLRRSFTMIPQSPTFYRCSVRDYLDPFHEFDDARLWRELLTVELGSRVRSLEEELLDNGENWSLGQRQLLCFARALLKPSRVVVLDESFSCVDQSCQEKILRIVRERMATSTVILITHRLDQILAFDRILVMSRGRVVESGSASELASNPASVFYEFLETSLLTFCSLAEDFGS